MGWGIQTTYLPRENLRFIEEWLAYHTLLGAEYFHLYDNTGSTELVDGHSIAVDGMNKYGMQVDMRLTDAQILEIEADIFKKYPVTKITWQPRENGQIVNGQVAAVDHFAEGMKSGWCAFIDMDEFIYASGPVADLLRDKAVIMLQKKFDDRFGYDTALEITKTFKFNTLGWASKLILDMEHYIPGGINIHHLNVLQMGVPLHADINEIRINHYNHNPTGHAYMAQHLRSLDPSWTVVPHDQVFTERCELALNLSRKLDYDSFVLWRGWR